MKKLWKMMITIVMLTSLFIATGVSAIAETGGESDETPIPELILNQNHAGIPEEIYNRELYDDTMAEYDLTDMPILPIFVGSPLLLQDLDPNAMEGERSVGDSYVVLAETPYRVTFKASVKTALRVVGWRGSGDGVPTYVRDLMNSSIYDSELHVAGDSYIQIWCFQDQASSAMTVFYVKENGGATVRYYESSTGEPRDFTLETFRMYAAALENYFKENPKEAPMYGTYPFLSFVDQVESGKISLDGKKTTSTIWIAVGVGAVIAVAVGAVIVVCVVKKKRKAIQEEG